jgi:hypothetical protein
MLSVSEDGTITNCPAQQVWNRFGGPKTVEQYEWAYPHRRLQSDSTDFRQLTALP